MGSYVLDFFCEEIRLAVEIDGEVHREQIERDARRDGWLAEKRILVMRFTASDVTKDVDWVVETIRKRAMRRKMDAEREKEERKE